LSGAWSRSWHGWYGNTYPS